MGEKDCAIYNALFTTGKKLKKVRFGGVTDVRGGTKRKRDKKRLRSHKGRRRTRKKRTFLFFNL